MTKYLNRLKYVKLNDLIHVFLFLFAIPCSLIFKMFHRNLWIVSDDGNDARDNGFWFFKYTRENHPEVDCVYTLKKSSPDNDRVRQLGKVIPYGTFLHWIYYLSASKIISSQKSGNPNAAVCYFLFVSGLIKNKRIFLQHGITKDDIKSFYYSVCKCSLFVTATARETEYIENNYGYKNKNIVKMLGFCRFDNLLNFKEVYKPKQILLMPTWRDWIVKHVSSSYKYDDISDFTKTEYFEVYHSLLENKQLRDKLVQNDMTLVFYPHKHMQKFVSYFESDLKNIKIADWHEYEVQPLLMESALLITDYSSVAFDFAYMQKPVLYYQFDLEKLRTGHYQQGYFSYENDGFGGVCMTEQEIVDSICKAIDSNFELEEKYKIRGTEFFTLRDKENSERNFNAVKDL